MQLTYGGVGSRETPVPVLAEMRRLASDLAYAGWSLRSGGADGADTAFEKGHRDAKKGQGLEVFLPWPGYNLREGITLKREKMVEAMRIAAPLHPAWFRCSYGAKKLHARNVAIMLGIELDQAVAAVVCWTKDGGPTGGTGMAMRIAEARGIPIFNLWTPEPENEVETPEEVAEKLAARRAEIAESLAAIAAEGAAD